jgi:methionyl aminopeptidase
MTICNDDELSRLKDIGAIVASVLAAMGRALEPGMTTRELDAIGRRLLEAEGARPAPELAYGFPGATCISVNEEVAHGIPGDRVVAAGDLVNIDVSAEKDDIFADTGASFAMPPVADRAGALCRDGRRALWAGLRTVRSGARLSEIGRSVEQVARRGGYTLVRNLASHGVGRALHEEPGQIPTRYEPGDRRVMHDGMVFTIEPFLSTAAEWVDLAPDGWTLTAEPGVLTVQYEHTVVATKRGPLVVTTTA